MSDINKCLKIKLDWNICSTKLILEDENDLNTYKENMNECFKFYVKYKECLKNIKD